MAYKQPNFFILGAAKSGTTSLYFWLKQHPEIFLSEVKETCFFSESFQVVDNPIDYVNLFRTASKEKIIGEASHVYLTNPATAQVLHSLFPEAKFVVVLRNPVDRAYSLYHHMVRHGYEWCRSFEQALEVEESRFCAPDFKNNCGQYYYNFFYYRSGLYGEQLARYLDLFPRENFYIIPFVRLKNDPLAVLREIFHFLSVDTEFFPEVAVHNQGTMTARWPNFHYALHQRWPFRSLPAIRSMLASKNLVPVPPLSEKTRGQLMARYQDDLQRLYELTGVTVS
ncbi:MAG: sulfotransferase [Deltaproteobacteria bacterium]|nr:MAG: sulfotransferase [Deltaproteobacteria bacterium]